ncbi:TPA: zinc-binding dehydrogenase [Pseudomonas putida]|nr:zinc-binding dehydrogenase [Pseudomonas putida]HDS1802920.1 zinc-binding dehydrogenase [Pseudomonas putida]HDS1808852.1 zinc-binding dehydrogenase [Pseudomonas putida]
MNARVIAIHTNQQRLDHARRLGADVTFAPHGDGDVAQAILELTGGQGIDKSLETSGAASARSAAIRAAKTLGSCCFVGEGDEMRINVSPELLRRQMPVMGLWTVSTTGQAECVAVVAANGIDVGQLYSERPANPS